MYLPLKIKKKDYKVSGFTLIEMAVVMVIVGIVVSIIATVLPSLILTSKIKKARALLEKADYSLEGYLIANNRLPCPDIDGDGIADPNNGNDCNCYAGDLPYHSIGLSNGNDVWGNPIRYSVYGAAGSPPVIDLTNTFASADEFRDKGLIPAENEIAAGDDGILGTGDDGFFSAKAYTTFTDINDSPVSLTNAGQAYILISGGPKDLSQPPGFFDDLNDTADLQFDAPNKLLSPTYDDLVRARSVSYLLGRYSTGGAAGGPNGVIGENAYPNGCSNGVDDDGDGYIDCDDQDCWNVPPCGAGGENVRITTSNIPSGIINSNYSVDFQATGGIIPYEWTLTNNGGFTDLFLNTYTGDLSGRLNQCPGAYTIQAMVEDSTLPSDGGPKNDTKSFSITVTADMSVARTSGSGTVIMWDSPSRQESFKANGGHLGSIGWTLDTGGAAGFYCVSTGDDTCNIIKKEETIPGTYNFRLTAADHDCSGNSADIGLTVEVTEAGAGPSYSKDLVAEWRFDECSWDGTEGEVQDAGDAMLDGTAVNGASTIGTGKNCRAGIFDGVNDYITVPDSPELRLGRGMTVALWLKVNNDASTSVRLAGKGNLKYRNYGLWLSADGTILFQIYSKKEKGNARTKIKVNDGNWHYIAGVYNGSVMKVYIDGRERASLNFTKSPYTSNDAFLIAYDGFHSYFNGKIDEVMLFNKAKTEEEITDLYKMARTSCSGVCYTAPAAEYRMENYPWSGEKNEVRDSGSGASSGMAASCGSGDIPKQTSVTEGKVGRAGIFSRIDADNGGYLDIGDPSDGDLDPGTGQWTISGWINWDGSSGENIIYNKENLYEARVSGGYVRYAWQPDWNWDGENSFSLERNTWTYVTTVYDGHEQLLYQDGINVYSRRQTGAIGQNSSKLLIGARGSSKPRNFFGGMIDEIKIYNRALAENEIKKDRDETR